MEVNALPSHQVKHDRRLATASTFKLLALRQGISISTALEFLATGRPQPVSAVIKSPSCSFAWPTTYLL